MQQRSASLSGHTNRPIGLLVTAPPIQTLCRLPFSPCPPCATVTSATSATTVASGDMSCLFHAPMPGQSRLSGSTVCFPHGKSHLPNSCPTFTCLLNPSHTMYISFSATNVEPFLTRQEMRPDYPAPHAPAHTAPPHKPRLPLG